MTYRAFDPFNPVDLDYHLFRWSDHRAVESMDAFEATWQFNLEREHIRTQWIANHRARAIASAYPRLSRWLPKQVFCQLFIPALEFLSRRREIRSRKGKSPRPLIPNAPNVSSVKLLLQASASSPIG